MSEKVVLPKFDLPGQGPHPAVKALAVIGGLLGLSMLALGGALWHHHSQEVAAEEAATALVAARQAEATAAVEAAKAKKAESEAESKAESQGKLAAAKSDGKVDGKSEGQPAAKSQGSSDTADRPVVAAGSHHRSSGHHHGVAHAQSKPGKALAKGDNHGKSTAASNKKKDDAIDKLLAQFK